jgi:hypothetical protein
MDLLQHLSAQHLTQLNVLLPRNSTDVVKAVARLTSLQDLYMSGSYYNALHVPKKVMQHLAASLQQLTQLRIGPMLPAKLQHLPPKLQVLHAAVDVNWDDHTDLAMLCRKELTVRSLEIETWSQCQRNCTLASDQSDTVLSPLSALQQLTYLGLGHLRRVQLQHLQLPQLQHLGVRFGIRAPGETIQISHGLAQAEFG